MAFTYITVPRYSSNMGLLDPLASYSDPDILSATGLGLLDLLASAPRLQQGLATRPRREGTSAESKDLSSNSNKFQLLLNVKHFRPEELSVKTVDRFVVVHGKHEESADEHGLVSREFTRRYAIPDDVDENKIQSSLSKDGVLSIQAPKKVLQPPPKNERVIPITLQKTAVQEQQDKLKEEQKKQEEEQKKQEGEQAKAEQDKPQEGQ